MIDQLLAQWVELDVYQQRVVVGIICALAFSWAVGGLVKHDHLESVDDKRRDRK